jgi:FixJ family two-component response regulator
MLSRLSGIEAKVTAFDIGIDDYLTKPFDKAELIARVHAVVRRNRGFSPTRQVMVHGKEVRLTGKEYSMLELLRSGTHPRNNRLVAVVAGTVARCRGLEVQLGVRSGVADGRSCAAGPVLGATAPP